MFITKKPLLSELVLKTHEAGVRAYLEGTVHGVDADYRTPFWGKIPRVEVLTRWKEIFDSHMETKVTNNPNIWDSLILYEYEQSAKVGPLSYQAPLDERLPGILEYWESIEGIGEYNLPVRSFESLFKELRPLVGIRMRTIDATVAAMKLNTNSGLPYFSRRNGVTKEYIELARELWNDYSHDISSERDKVYAAILGWRGQEGGPEKEDVKQRTVFMMPFHINILELMVYQPIILGLQKIKAVPAYISHEEVERRMTLLFDTKAKEDPVIATDFTKMDQHFNPIMQNISRSVINFLLGGKSKPENSRVWLEKVFPIKFNIPLLCSRELIISGSHGMGSGSGGTNVDETLAHRYLQHVVAERHGAKLNINSQCLGDDGVISYPGITTEHIVKVYSEFGQVMNPEKQYISTDHTIYLRRWYHTKYRDDNHIMLGVYPTFRALGRLLGQERFYDPKKWSKEMVIFRALAILENTKNHPLFTTFVDFVIDGDQFKLGLNIPGFFDKLEKSYQEAKNALPILSSYTQENMSNSTSINDWHVVKYLKSKL